MRSWPLFLLPIAVALAAAPFVPSPDQTASGASAVRPGRPWIAPGAQIPSADGRLPTVPASPDTSGPRAAGGAGGMQEVYAAALSGAARVNIGQSGTGSGFFLTADGLLLTAAHVALADPGEVLTVTVSDGRTLPARLVGYDEARDVALLRVQGSGFTPLPLAASAPRVGDGIVAIGNSRGNFDGGRAGQVTALNVSLDASFPSGLVASSMPLAPGDSGGPVLNANGEVVGVSTAISEQAGQFSSYFVPLTASSQLVADLRAGVQRGVPVLGVSVADARDQLGTPGALVTEVAPGLGAQRAGLRPATVQALQDEVGREARQVVSADVIVGVDGRPVTSPGDLVAYLRGRRAGDRVTLEVRRDGQTRQLSVTLSDKRGS